MGPRRPDTKKKKMTLISPRYNIRLMTTTKTMMMMAASEVNIYLPIPLIPKFSSSQYTLPPCLRGVYVDVVLI